MLLRLNIESYEKAKPHICMRLINCERNRKYLQYVPHVSMGDIAVVFFNYAEIGKMEGDDWKESADKISPAVIEECMMPTIGNDLLESWGVSVEQLYEDALQNAPKILHPRLETIENVLGIDNDSEESSLYVLTNRMTVNGASSILYPGLLEAVSAELDDDFYIIPSSIHEVLLFPASKIDDPKLLKRYVKEINENEVMEKEILSDSIYLYNRDLDRFEAV